MRKILTLILVVFVIFNAAAQAPPPAPLEPPGGPLDGNLLGLLIAGLGYSLKKFYNYKYQVKKIKK